MTLPIRYPPPPWRLRGSLLYTPELIPLERARRAAPADLEIVALFPGFTAGGLMLATYGTGSTLAYHELLAVSAVIRAAGRLAGWVSRLYVDHEVSQMGGREIWALPKEQAEFRWDEASRHVSVRRNGCTLCELSYGRPIQGWRQRFTLQAAGRDEERLTRFLVTGRGRVGIARAGWRIPPESPLAPLGIGRSRFVLTLCELDATVLAPES
jgi:hypothetical protein